MMESTTKWVRSGGAEYSNSASTATRPHNASKNSRNCYFQLPDVIIVAF